MYRFEELDDETRSFMLREFDAEEDRGEPYRGARLSSDGRTAFPVLMREAIRNGSEVTLEDALTEDESYWNQTYQRAGRPIEVNIDASARMLAIGEFNTWYVRGLARKLMDEGATHCQVYRARETRNPRKECEQHEEQSYSVQAIYDGHRARYWPAPGNPEVLSIPVGPNCHHTIRRISAH